MDGGRRVSQRNQLSTFDDGQSAQRRRERGYQAAHQTRACNAKVFRPLLTEHSMRTLNTYTGTLHPMIVPRDDVCWEDAWRRRRCATESGIAR